MNRYSNIKKMVAGGDLFWSRTQEARMSGIVADNLGDGFMQVNDDKFINMCSYSYLGLDSNIEILNGAITALDSSRTLNSSTSRVRICLPLLEEAELALSDLFSVDVLTTVSCASAAAAMLPLLAAGVFTQNIPPLMVFDQCAHFCLSLMKAVCADESEVVTAPHNDLNFLEDCCKKKQRVAYIADGVYSTGGCANISELMTLQDKYGLFVLYDEAHGLSAQGANGCGLVLNTMGTLNNNTMIIASLNKGFGASGGAIFFDSSINKANLLRFGGPLSWSQRINTAGLGAIIAAAKIHKSTELQRLQNRLTTNIQLFDMHIKTPLAGDGLPIRLIPMGDEQHAITTATKLMKLGFYTSPLFYPVVPKSTPGLRVMLRANLASDDLKQFCTAVNSML
ncbi:aminotransferase class I/II-fold pyridoxal phosphate-dependent enzyme [Pseudomonas gessardii]|uniref:Aminotransferase class I/II-fold pyridoxal phosphate-dependent enzyme n=1 Tax=Pseudomonas gessardii TaxID=78544 RepID=A0A7Y1QPT3_9PSED|nr:aminotransferase class I/II-fold pyridoxal phosphate-dependent enzyme [Pseudomonas gessardii]MRU52146.1 aminotransferase class I/II-fold pyridoxal phosphate-dependent enzyme [Pseudomonas gessardii]NNA99495.1 aminotransferase class I/II-fold pyridoxal phosphate-dependent enzyme [Pseudomonas gessardii]ONH40289.1 aminotransferase class I and II [Pseudomonas gessardii]